MQLDRALYGLLIIDDPAEPGGCDVEWLVVVDNWIDGTGRTPDSVLTGLNRMGGIDGMGRAAWGARHGGGGRHGDE